MTLSKKHQDYRLAIASSGLDIYAPISVEYPALWIPIEELERLLNIHLIGYSLEGLPNRTRSKVVKGFICEALGYPAPKSFKKTQPRFLGQQLDVYVQKSSNLQIWNEDLSPKRRYAIVAVSKNDFINKVILRNGEQLTLLDKTGTMTTKYQAQLVIGEMPLELVSKFDTAPLLQHLHSNHVFTNAVSPTGDPVSGCLLSIQEIFSQLSCLIGKQFPDPGIDQERNRGAALHRLICESLGYSRYEDTGQFPDIRHQLLEVKLQTSPTIDLGLIQPSSEERLDISSIGTTHPRHCDVRYAMFYAITDGKTVTLTHLFVTTGKDFFTRFRRFEGRVRNGKIQIPLPSHFFDC